MKDLTLLIFIFCQVTIVNCQTSKFISRLENIKATFSNYSLEDNLNRLNDLKKSFEGDLIDCANRVEYFRMYAHCYYHFWEDEKTLIMHRDSVLPLLLKCNLARDELVPMTYFNIGDQHRWLGRIDSSRYYYDKCIQSESKIKTPGQFSGRHYTFVGDFIRTQGDIEKSIVYHEKAVSILKGEKKMDSYLTQRNFARSYRDKLDYLNEEKHLLKAKSLVDVLYPKKDNKHYSYTCEELGTLYHRIENLGKAEKFLIESKLITLKNLGNYSGKISDLNRQSKFLSYVKRDQGNIAEALKLQKELKEYHSNPANNSPFTELSGIIEDIGDTHYAAKDYSQALSEYQEAMQLMVRNLDTDVLKNPSILNNQITNKDFLRRQLGLKSKALYAAGLEKKDNSYFLSAIDAIQKYDTLVRMKLNQDFEEGSHQTLFDQSKEYYKYGILAAKELHSKNPTIENANYLYGFISKLKSQLLYRNIQQEEKQEKELTEDQLAQKDTLEKQVSEKQLAIQTAEFNGDEAGYKTAINDYFDLKLEQESFLRELGLEDVLDLSDFIETATIEEIQNKLDDKTAILEYYLVDEKIIQVTIRKDHYNISTADFDASSLIKLYGELSSGENVTKHAAKDILGKMLDGTIPPAEIENLIIIPDEELLQFPFEILERDGQKLVNQYNISYEYGSAFLFDESINTTGDEFVGFASDYNSPQFNLLNENYTYNTTGIKLSPLENAAKEIELSKASLGGSIFINQEATKEKFEGQAANSSILHLAMHGVLHERIPDLSALVFESEKEDFLLTASEIYNLDIPTNLTVLSACNSGVGPIQTGDGVRSLTRSFIHAGSESVITSLWEASDASTSQILTSFYKFLKEGKSKSESLRLAKLEYLEGASPTYQHPKYWAHLVLVGNTAPIFGGSTGKLTFWIIVAVALLFVLVFLLRKLATQKTA